MSTYWNIECSRCGLEVFEDSYGWTKHQGVRFAELCASRLLDTLPHSTDSWRLTVINEFERTIDLGRIRESGLDCDHDFEPRNEYGHWATPDMWPDWHPKSRVIVAIAGAECEGLGESRCIG